MLELFKKNDVLFVKALMKLRLPIKYQNKVFGKEEQTILLLPEEVNFILARNGNIRLWNGKKFIKLNLGEFYDIIEKNQFKVVNFVEPKKEQPVQQPKVEQPKKEEVKIVEPKKEEPVQQPKVEQPKKEEVKQNDNKKQRHNNNNKPQNSGGDK
jgi:outer membrane biosynthesis protein TonB